MGSHNDRNHGDHLVSDAGPPALREGVEVSRLLELSSVGEETLGAVQLGRDPVGLGEVGAVIVDKDDSVSRHTVS